MVTVVAPHHPLAALDGPIPTARLAEETQIVLSEQRVEAETPDQAVLSPKTWRVHDLQMKGALLLEGLGWGNMPYAVVEADLRSGRLVRIQPAVWPEEGLKLPLSVVLRADTSLGPAATWLLEALARGCDPSHS